MRAWHRPSPSGGLGQVIDWESNNTLLLERIEPWLRPEGWARCCGSQLPENFHRDDNRLRNARKQFRGAYRHCIEFRHGLRS